MTKLKIEVGKSYETRDGRKAIAIDFVSYSNYGFIVKVSGLNNKHSYTREGRYVNSLTDNPLDLVRVWESPNQ